MAQIVTITNPLTGQPAQVDQLDHTAQEIDDAIARALPGGAIDLEKAPAGYGLGSVGITSLLDANTAKRNGWYIGRGDNAVNFPSYNHKYGELFVLTRNNTIEQFAIYQGTICVRYSTDGGTTWSTWEYVNPPMALGVEYRTTERYLGKPVYVKTVDCGAMPSSERKKVDHSIPNIKNVIRCVGQRSNGDSIPSQYAASDHASIFAGKSSIYIYVGIDMSATTATAQLWYTKTTD